MSDSEDLKSYKADQAYQLAELKRAYFEEDPLRVAREMSVTNNEVKEEWLNNSRKFLLDYIFKTARAGKTVAVIPVYRTKILEGSPYNVKESLIYLAQMARKLGFVATDMDGIEVVVMWSGYPWYSNFLNRLLYAYEWLRGFRV